MYYIGHGILSKMAPIELSILFSLIFSIYSGTVEDTELVEGLVLEQKVSHIAGGTTRVEKAKIGLIQFCISPPKTDVTSYSFCYIRHVLSLPPPLSLPSLFPSSIDGKSSHCF